MATPSRGIGKGNNSGGRNNPPGGRPRGSRNRRSAALIAEAERTGQLPVDFLLQCMRDRELPLAQRIACANAAAPYTSARLTTLPAFSNPEHLDDTALMSHLKRLERFTEVPAGEKSAMVESQVEQLLEELPQLPDRSQESLLRKLVTAGEAGLQRLNDPNRPGVSAAWPARRPLTRPGADPAPAPQNPGNLNGKRLRYNAATGQLEPVS